MPDTVLRHHIKPPAQFNPYDKTVNWKLWRQMFENYMVASNYATLEDAEKRAVLLANSTPKCYEIFTTLNSGTTYAEAIKALETYYCERFSKTYAVYKIRKLQQETGQDVSTFASTLISAAQQRDFGGQVDVEVQQQLISGIREPRICQELLLMADTETLENVLKRANHHHHGWRHVCPLPATDTASQTTARYLGLSVAISLQVSFHFLFQISDLIRGGFRMGSRSSATVVLQVFLIPPSGRFQDVALSNINASLVTPSSVIRNTCLQAGGYVTGRQH